MEERERIFELFYRIDNDTVRSAPGTGMGLALVQKLVGLLDGSISVDDTPGGGATFRVNLPLTSDALVDRTSLLSAAAITPYLC